MSQSTHRIGIYPGSFDPLTYGHLNIIDRAAKLFDRLVVSIAVNDTKVPLFTPEERAGQIRAVTSGDSRIEVDYFAGLLVDYARKKGACAIVRGLRAVSDFDYEFQMAHMNHKIGPEIETVFMMTGEDHFYVSSRLVKEVASLGGDVTGLVPDEVFKDLCNKYKALQKGVGE